MYPSPGTAARHPFVEHPFIPLDEGEMHRRAVAFHQEMAGRRSARVFNDRPVPRQLIDLAIATAATAPSGAHQQPWTFVVIGDPDTKRRIREAAEGAVQARTQISTQPVSAMAESRTQRGRMTGC